jgi:Putative adhesin
MGLRIALIALVAAVLVIPTLADSRIEKSLSLAPGGRFVLDADSGSVSVTGTDQSGASIVITSNRDDLQNLFEFKFDDDSGAVRVRAERREHWSWFDNLNLHYEIRVPKSTQLDIKTGGGGIEVNSIARDADLKTSGGSIQVLGVVGKLHAQTSGGHVHAEEVQGDADLETSGGSIEADSIDGSLSAHTSGGSIHIQRVTGRVDAHTSGGGITAALGKKNGHGGTLETSGGSISASIDPSANLHIDASTSGGHVSSDLPIRVSGSMSSHELHGALGSGGETLVLHTSGGSIHLSAL